MKIYKIRFLHKTEEQEWENAECISEVKGIIIWKYSDSICAYIRAVLAYLKYAWKNREKRNWYIDYKYVGPEPDDTDFIEKKIADVTCCAYSIGPVTIGEGVDYDGTKHQIGMVKIIM